MGLLSEKQSEKSQHDQAVALDKLVEINGSIRRIEADGLALDHLLPRLLALATGQFVAHQARLFLFDANLQLEQAWYGGTDRTPQARTEFQGQFLPSGVERWCAENRVATIIRNSDLDERSTPAVKDLMGPQSAICCPLQLGGVVFGTLLLQTTARTPYGTDELALLEAWNEPAAIVIANARRYEDTQRQLKVLALLNEASRAINSSLDVDKIMQSLLAKMNELLNAAALSIGLVDKGTQELVYRVAEGVGSHRLIGLRVPANQGVSGWVMSHGEPALVPDTRNDSRFDRRGDLRTGYLTRAMICAPLKAAGEVLGTIQAINPVAGTFTGQDLELLVSLANLAATAFANANLYAASQAAEERYLSLFEENVDPILITAMSGEIIEVNRKAVEFLGYSRSELLEMSVTELHATDAGSALSTRTKGVLIFTSEVVTKTGQRVPVEVHAQTIDFGDRQALQWIERDITEQVEMEEMRRDMTAMLFHDLQSPLGNVLSSLELVELEMPAGSDDAHAMLEVAVDSGRRLQALIHSLLDIDRLEAGDSITNRRPVPMARLIDDAERLVKAGLDRQQVILRRELAPDLPLVHVDADMITRVILNLLDNALKYTPKDSTVTVHAGLGKKPHFVYICVSDQGNGIPEPYHRTIFDKFRRVKSDDPPKGLGLGLAFCRLAVEAHGGRIWVDNTPEGGACFSFIVPTS